MVKVTEYLENWTATQSADGTLTEYEVPYSVLEAADLAEAFEAVRAKAPAEFNGMSIDHFALDEVLSHNAYRIKAVYAQGSAVPDTSGDTEEKPTMSFECSAGNIHIISAIRQEKVYGDKDDELDSNVGCMIGWNGKLGEGMEIAGVDVPTAGLRESYTKVMKTSNISTSFKRKVASLTGKVNNGSFKGWNAGEVMFMGMSYSAPLKGNEKVTVTFSFNIQPNENNVRIADKSIGDKKGFEYLWVVYKSRRESNKPTAGIRAIYKAEVVESANFSDLGL